MMNRQFPDHLAADDDYYYTDELMELLWRKGGPMEQTLASGVAPPPPVSSTADHELARMFVEEDEMAAWLYQIVEAPGGNSSPPPPQEINGEAATVVASSVTPSAVAEEATKKRKVMREGLHECRCSADAESDSTEKKKDTCRSTTSTKRARSAHGHNLTEQRRRDKINEKMRTLQELIPSCTKSDKASMLDEAIGYLKSLQLQVQIMSMGYGMRPVMFPGIQSYMQPIGMGMGIGIGAGVHMGMAMGPRVPVGAEVRPGGLGHPIFPFAPMFPYFHHPVMPSPNATDSTQMRNPPSNQQGSTSSNISMQRSDMSQVPRGGDAHYFVRPNHLKESPQSAARDRGGTRTKANK